MLSTALFASADQAGVPSPSAAITAHDHSPMAWRAATGAAALGLRRHSIGGYSRPWTKLANVPFPTVDGQSQLLDVYLPRGPAPAGGWPVLMAIHGGGWRRFSKDTYGPRIGSAFVPRGYAVIAPDYVLSSPGRPTWPLNFEDIEAAVRWARIHAPEFGINPNRIAAIGESAGANMAALLGSTEAIGFAGGYSSQVNAVIGFSTPTDLTSLYEESPLGGLAAAQFLGGTPEEVPSSYAAASPIDHVSTCDAPMFLVHGMQDSLIPLSQAKSMASALAAVGVRHELILVHGGHDLDFPEHYANLIPQILEFLNASWNDKGVPSFARH
jgi:acetyl esterase/lipase